MKKFFKGFVYAFRGIWLASRGRNMRVQCLIALLATFAGVLFQITRLEWIALLFCFALVLFAEGFNTALEYVINLIRDECGAPYENENLGKAKDIAAGAVLITAVFAAIIGGIVFLPRFLSFLG